MRKKNGFISMSIIYSFFTVFMLVSTSLLLIYSNNLSIVKSVNKQIKTDLTTKGNNSLMIFKNLIADGSFENISENWTVRTGDNMCTPNYIQQKYYGSQSLGMIKTSSASYCYIQSTHSFPMYHDHYYYISRIYLAFRSVYGNDLILKLTPAGYAYFNETGAYDIMNNAYGKMYSTSCDDVTNTDNCKYGNVSINKERYRFQSGFCLGVNGRCSAATSGENAAQTSANTLESGIFKFNGSTGNYRLLIGANFTDYQLTGGIFPRYYTDGYMLVDLTVALQLDNTKANKLFDNTGAPGGYRIGAEKIDNLLDGKFIEDQRTLPTYSLGLT